MTSFATIVVDNQNLAWTRSYKRAKRANQYHDSDEYDEDKPLSPKTLIRLRVISPTTFTRPHI